MNSKTLTSFGAYTAPSGAELFAAGLLGTHFKFVEIEAYAAGGKEGLRLVDEFKTLLVRTYASSLAAYSNQRFDFPPQRLVTRARLTKERAAI